MKNQPIKKSGYKRYKGIIQDIGSIGDFTGRELTWGTKNGWHPHRHVLFFCKIQNVAQLRRLHHDVTIAWALAFIKAGGRIRNMNHFQQRSVRVDQITDDDGYMRISRYITTVEGETWTLAKEATKGIVKTAKNGNITPFGMLEGVRQADPLSGLYIKKFNEYSTTMKGKKQFFGSPGLAKKLGIKNVSDEDILSEKKTGNHYFFFTDFEWHIITENELRGEIIKLSEGVNDFEFIGLFENYIKDFKKIGA